MALPDLKDIREERRFLMTDVEAVLQLLAQRGELSSYHTRTQYVDTPEGTWSRDPDKPRYRFRVYDSRDAFLEVKLRVPNTRVYLKRRRPQDTVPEGMVSLGQSQYTRQEWEHGDVRVTIDSHVSTDDRTLPGFVVETKLPVGQGLPNWLKLLKPYETSFSKWGWVSS